MGGTGVIDNFLGTFTQYIDSGFGLVQGDVRWLAGVLIAIDITLAGLFWAMAPDEDVIARLIRKTLTIASSPSSSATTTTSLRSSTTPSPGSASRQAAEP
jgi:hypothetical protein